MDGRKKYSEPDPADVIRVLKAAGQAENVPAAPEKYIDPAELLPPSKNEADIRDPEQTKRMEFFRTMAGGDDSGDKSERAFRFHFDAASALKDFRKKNLSPGNDSADTFAAYGKPPGAPALLPEGTSSRGYIPGEEEEAQLKVFREIGAAMGEPGNPGKSADPARLPVGMSAAVRRFMETGVKAAEPEADILGADMPKPEISKSVMSPPADMDAMAALRVFREMSGVSGSQEDKNFPIPIADKPEESVLADGESISPAQDDAAAHSSALETVRKLRERGGVIREDEPESTPENVPAEGEALEFLKMFREMSGVSDPQGEKSSPVPIEDKPEESVLSDGESILPAQDDAAAHSSALETVRKLRERGGVIREDEPESTPENVPAEGEALEFLKMFREMSGVPGENGGADVSLVSEPLQETAAVSKPEDIPEETEQDIAVCPEILPEADEPDIAYETKNLREESKPDAADPPEDEPAPISRSKPATYDLNISRRFGYPDLPEETAAPESRTDDPKVFRISWDEEQAARWRAYDPGKPKAEFSSSYKPPIDMEDIPLDEEILIEAKAAQEREREKCSLAACGADCTDCPFGEETDCTGCGGLCEDCDIVQCCAVWGHKHCGMCEYFPCDRLRQAAFDPESGDNGERLVRLKKMRETTGSRRNPRMMIAGVSGGVALGAAVGGFSGALVPWLFAGAVLGAGLGAIAGAAGKKS